MFIVTRALFEILSAVSTEFERKEYLAKMNYYPNTWRGAQCNRIGCIGLRPALPVAGSVKFLHKVKLPLHRIDVVAGL